MGGRGGGKGILKGSSEETELKQGNVTVKKEMGRIQAEETHV